MTIQSACLKCLEHKAIVSEIYFSFCQMSVQKKTAPIPDKTFNFYAEIKE